MTSIYEKSKTYTGLYPKFNAITRKCVIEVPPPTRLINFNHSNLDSYYIFYREYQLDIESSVSKTDEWNS